MTSIARALLWIVACALLGWDAETSAAQEIRFKSEGVLLSGSLFMPGVAAPEVALVLVHGSAKQDSMRMSALATALAQDGFAVLTYDKRGIGESQGVFQAGDNEAELTLLARDAVAAVDALAGNQRTRGARIGLLGISQGGWVGPIAASQTRRIEFMLLWSGPVCTLSEELHFSELGKRQPDVWRHEHSGEVRAHMRAVPRRAHDFDPLPLLKNVSVPVLWVFGARDTSIPVALSIERLDGLIEGGKRNFEYKVIPDGEHSLSYPDPATIEWLRQRAD